MGEKKPQCEHAILMCTEEKCPATCRAPEGKGCFEPCYECGARPDSHPCVNDYPNCYIAALEETVQHFKDKLEDATNLVDLYGCRVQEAEGALADAQVKRYTVIQELTPGVGDVIEWKGKQYKVVEDESLAACVECALIGDQECARHYTPSGYIKLNCGADVRPDETDVHLVELTQKGE